MFCGQKVTKTRAMKDPSRQSMRVVVGGEWWWVTDTRLTPSAVF
jgi:hypothetical protein